MAVDRLSVTVPSELGAALRALAKRRGDTVSTIVTEAIAHQVRLAALDIALAEDEREFGPIPRELLDASRAALTPKSPARKRRVPSRARR